MSRTVSWCAECPRSGIGGTPPRRRLRPSERGAGSAGLLRSPQAAGEKCSCAQMGERVGIGADAFAMLPSLRRRPNQESLVLNTSSGCFPVTLGASVLPLCNQFCRTLLKHHIPLEYVVGPVNKCDCSAQDGRARGAARAYAFRLAHRERA